MFLGRGEKKISPLQQKCTPRGALKDFSCSLCFFVYLRLFESLFTRVHVALPPLSIYLLCHRPPPNNELLQSEGAAGFVFKIFFLSFCASSSCHRLQVAVDDQKCTKKDTQKASFFYHFFPFNSELHF